MNYKEQEGKWTVSDNDELFREGEYFDTPEEAIAYGREEYTDGQTCFFIGRVESVGIMADSLAEEVVERISEIHYSEHGELAEDYLDSVTKEHSDELDERLQEVIAKWAEEFGYLPNYFLIGEMQTIEIDGGAE